MPSKKPSRKNQKNFSNKFVSSIKVLLTGYLLYVIPTVISVIILVSIVSAAGGKSVEQLSNDLEASPAAQLVGSVMTGIVLSISLWLILRKQHDKWQDIGLRKPQFKHFGYAVVAYAVFLVSIYIVKFLLGHYINFNQEEDIGYKADLTGAGLLYAFITVVVIAPLIEELVFRGYTFSRLRKYLGFVLSAVLVSLLFAKLHLHNGKGGSIAIEAFVETFIASVILSYLREKTGNIWAGVSVHATNNLISFITFFTFFHL
jgi:membrane protease YdiL (CAAX protease family)